MAAVEPRAALTSFSIQGRGSLTAGGRTLRGDFIITAARPGCLRFEAYGPFGIPVLFVVVRGDEVQAVSFLERRYFSGPATSKKMASFLPLSLSAPELIALLSAAPLPPEPTGLSTAPPGEAAPLQYAAKAEGCAVLLAQGPSGPLRLLFGDGGDLLAASLGQPGAELVALYSDWRSCPRQSQAARFPFKQEFSLPASNRSLRLEASEVRLGEPLPESAFELSPPPGFKVVTPS